MSVILCLVIKCEKLYGCKCRNKTSLNKIYFNKQWRETKDAKADTKQKVNKY